MPQHKYTETQLWKALDGRKSELDKNIYAALKPMLDKAEQILRDGAPATMDFTLHDADHAFRVAERMREIVSDEVFEKLSSYELALLLLSAYLHDIGMAPARKHVERHRRHILRGDSDHADKLTDAEALEVRRFLDNSSWTVTVPLAPDGKPDEAKEALANEILAYYCRSKHNDWSEAWINENLPAGGAEGALPHYPGWRADLVLICRSHHYGYDHLRGSDFVPMLVSNSHTVHRRYLACVLRVADVLENDPERTPPVLFEHRGVQASSAIYWQKDHPLNVIRDGDHLAAIAEPTSAALEKAVRMTVEWIEAELRLCMQLASELPFAHATFSTTKPLPHRWDYPAVVVSRITPKGGYVYIEGAFRPNTRRLLELLSGVALYQNPLVAVRELLQNAFDAVREAIALKRLQECASGDMPAPDDLAKLFKVELKLEQRADGRLWLVCRDDGIGMNRRVIENYLLVSGSSRRHEIEEIERRCQAHGFSMGRTGKFGIGALSYFMLADRVEFRTARRSHPLDAPESDGWEFTTNGVGAFGELRKVNKAGLGDGGCEVALRLRADVLVPDKKKPFPERLEEYLRETVRRVPCRFRWALNPNAKGWPVNLPPGWTWSAESRDRWLAAHIRDALEKLFGPESPNGFDALAIPESEMASRRTLRDTVVERIVARTRWVVQEIADDSGGMCARIQVPWFDLVAGASSVVLLHDPAFADLGLDLRECQGVAIQTRKLTSWRGMAVRSQNREESDYLSDRAIIEIDFNDESYGSPSVNRGSLSPSTEARRSAFERVKTACDEVGAKLVPAASPYALASASAVWWGQHCDAPIVWLQPDVAGTGLAWTPITTPVLLKPPFPIIEKRLLNLNSGEPVNTCAEVHIQSSRTTSTEISVLSARDPDRVCLCSVGDRTFGFAALVLPKTTHSRSTFPASLQHVTALNVAVDYMRWSLFVNPILTARWRGKPNVHGFQRAWSKHADELPTNVVQLDLTPWEQAAYLLTLLLELSRHQRDALWGDKDHHAALVRLLGAIAPTQQPDFRLSVLGLTDFSREWYYRTLSEKDGFVDDPDEALRLLELVKQEPGFHVIAEPAPPQKPKKPKRKS